MTKSRTAFDRFDHECSGTINVEDMVSSLSEAGRDVNEQQVFAILDEMGLSDGASGVRFHEFLSIVEQTKLKVSEGGEEGDDEHDAASFAASFQFLGGNPEDPEATISKETITKMLREFELDDNVDKVLGVSSPDAPGQKILKANLNLEDLKHVFKGDQDDS
eukprot:CAMPEP_0173390302 /NCGR_PEP_ID=MMETSP1356-20130122/14410_1 /TAXON_ID=77927 ORGANISM="Hemiselmis virescens, Strain PCC157" /NCGR_SAMPLE_ID=MMETSP1356 /ASSEMBLY_ACC=CAM_ASM_000847 /LENGTH=161 /DNA_ID=CAMNT_0014347647 /DNA_START=94 /DNA_END=579 /DNA_ORIENTATION=+